MQNATFRRRGATGKAGYRTYLCGGEISAFHPDTMTKLAGLRLFNLEHSSHWPQRMGLEVLEDRAITASHVNR
jgi:hypothetical protein